jgi:hypothetical protein
MGMLSVAGIVWAAPAFGQADPAAKKALEESAEAIKNMGPSTFTIVMSTEGLGKFGLSSNMKVKLIKATAKGAGNSYQMVGEFVSPGGKPDDTKVNAAYLEGKMGEWIDETAKTLFIRPLRAVKTDTASKEVLSKVQTPSKAFEVLFLDPDPFKTELGLTDLTMEKAANINGEECQVVKATLAGGTAYRLIYISALDKLPRKYEQYMGKAGGPQQIRRFEIKDLNEAKLTVQDLHLKLPAGFQTDKVDLPPPPPPAPPVDPNAPKKESLKDKKDPAKDKEDEKRKDEERQKAKDKQKEKTPEDPAVPMTAPPGKQG